METICSATGTAGTFTLAEAAGTGESHVTVPPSEPEAMQMQLCRHPAVYPEALAKHEEVIANRDLFMSTLTRFHAALGTKLS
jgi:hypothetical protein